MMLAGIQLGTFTVWVLLAALPWLKRPGFALCNCSLPGGYERGDWLRPTGMLHLRTGLLLAAAINSSVLSLLYAVPDDDNWDVFDWLAVLAHLLWAQQYWRDWWRHSKDGRKKLRDRIAARVVVAAGSLKVVPTRA